VLKISFLFPLFKVKLLHINHLRLPTFLYISGFDNNSLQKACCGIGGEYNYDVQRQCGDPGVPVCIDPSTHISWDGVHLTQNAYRWIARWLIDDILPKLNCQV